MTRSRWDYNPWLGEKKDFPDFGAVINWEMLYIKMNNIYYFYSLYLYIFCINEGLIGLALSYALTLTSTLSAVVNAFTETEREMIAVERINQFYELLPEENNDSIENRRHNSSIPPPYGWPALGVINFINVALKYKSDLDRCHLK